MGEVTVELDPASVSGSIEARDGMPCAGRLAAVHPEIALAAECGRRGRASTATRCRRPPRSRHSSAAANPAAAMLAVAVVAILKLLGRTGSPPVSLVESRAAGSSPAQRQSSARTPRASLPLLNGPSLAGGHGAVKDRHDRSNRVTLRRTGGGVYARAGDGSSQRDWTGDLSPLGARCPRAGPGGEDRGGRPRPFARARQAGRRASETRRGGAGSAR